MKVIIFCILALFSVSCKKEKTLRIGINEWAGYELLSLAKHKGFFKKHGLNVELLEYSSLSDVKTGFEQKQIDIMASTIIEAIQASETLDEEVKILLLTDYSNGPDEILSKYDDLKKLKGQKIGVEMGSLGVFMIARALKKNGLELKDVQLIPRDQTNMLNSLNKGEIDAAVTYTPTSFILREKIPSLKSVFNSGDIPFEILDTLTARKEIVINNPGLRRKLLLVWDESVNYLKENPEESIKFMAKREGLSVKVFKEILSGLVILNKSDLDKLFLEKRNEIKKTINLNIEVLKNTNQLKKDIVADQFLL